MYMYIVSRKIYIYNNFVLLRYPIIRQVQTENASINITALQWLLSACLAF